MADRTCNTCRHWQRRHEDEDEAIGLPDGRGVAEYEARRCTASASAFAGTLTIGDGRCDQWAAPDEAGDP